MRLKLSTEFWKALIRVDKPLLVFIRTLIFAHLISTIIIWLSPFFFNISGNFITSNTSAQYILSALAQSQAAIIAIVFTALLIFFQISLGLDSKKIAMDDFLKSRQVIVIISLYAYSIGYDLVLLALIKTKTTEVNVFWPIALMVILILYLIPSIGIMVRYTHKKVLVGGIRIGTQKFVQGADLSGASFVGIRSDGIKFNESDLSGAIFNEACLHESDFTDTDLKEAKFSKSDLSNSNFFRADFNKADLWMANLSGGNLSGAKFRKAAMWNVNLSGVNASDADFTRADLGGANLSGAYFAGAILKNANFSSYGVNPAS
ncbi:MAG TPA: hypothetical protein HA304_04245, partial [Methanosarcinales archaeon]|nr:hypothetical protein [Methanosarcinales archaeon]